MRSLLFLIWLVAALKVTQPEIDSLLKTYILLQTDHIHCILINETIFKTLNDLRTYISGVPALTSSYELSKDCSGYAQVQFELRSLAHLDLCFINFVRNQKCKGTSIKTKKSI